MITPPKHPIRYFAVNGKELPSWAWEALHAATRTADGRPSVVVVEPKTSWRRTVVLIDMDDYNAILEGMKP